MTRHSEKGVAILVVMLGLVLISGLGLFVLQNGMTQLQIARYVQKEAAQNALTDSGIDLVLAWYHRPDRSPDPIFFGAPCGEKDQHLISHKTEIGETLSFRFYGRSAGGRCPVAITGSLGKTIQVALGSHPMPNMAEKIYSGVPNNEDVQKYADPLDKEIKRFVKRFGRYFAVSEAGLLDDAGVLKSFDDLFANQDEIALVYIDNVKPVKIGKGPYIGYFYFAGDIEVEGGTLSPDSKRLNNVNLNGFFYTKGKMTFSDSFSVYGALHAGSGLSEEGIKPDVFHNEEYKFGYFEGILPLIPISGAYKVCNLLHNGRCSDSKTD
ncbi:MAG: hypothetical protein AAB035_02770 [Nitrospirota bacterium]